MRVILLRLTLIFAMTFLTGRLRAGDLPQSLYVLNSLARSLSRVDLSRQEVENDIIIVGEIPSRIHAKGDTLYVVNSTPPGITVIDASREEIIRNIALPEGSNPWDMTFAGGDTAYVTALLAGADWCTTSLC